MTWNFDAAAYPVLTRNRRKAMPYVPEEDRKPFNVRDHLDRPEVIKAYIGDLLVELDRYRTFVRQIARDMVEMTDEHAAQILREAGLSHQQPTDK
jgi:DNA-binding phage protein